MNPIFYNINPETTYNILNILKNKPIEISESLR